ncbi:hypothetical protein HHI36_009782, partial [Cryptolaemus montrouzieri]
SIFALDGIGRDIFRAVMSQERFIILLTALRFDDLENRKEKRKENPLVAVSQLFDLRIENT